MIAAVTLKCETCGKEFLRKKSEYDRCQRAGRKSFCCLNCAYLSSKIFVRNHDKNANIPSEASVKKMQEGFLKYNEKIKEKTIPYYPFKNYYKIAKRRAKKSNKSFSIAVEDLKAQWEKQNGKCPLTGWDMILKLPGNKPSNVSLSDYLDPRQASLDRIDNSRGYEKDNIRFVSYIANCASNCFTDIQLVEFCNAVINFCSLSLLR